MSLAENQSSETENLDTPNQEKAVYSTGENFAELFEASLKDEVKEGSVVKGEIVALDTNDAVIDIGFKAEGRVSLKEFGIKAELKVGDVVDVFLERLENQQGMAVISRERAVREESWEELEKAQEAGKTVDGVIFSRVKGGFTVDLNGIVAFLPGSQVDIRPVKDVGPLMNISQPFQILKMNRKHGNIVVSRRAILEESRDEARSEWLSGIQEGVELEGVVKNITDYGAFIDLGCVDGLLHVTDISWSRINHPSEVLSLGQTVKVKVIKYNEDTKRISLGMKQLESNPWEEVEARFTPGTRLSGRVTNITDYGAFVELESGIEGLVHVSEISWTRKNTHPSKLLSTSQEVDVMVLSVDPTKHRISLGIKQCEDNPWQKFADQHPVGEVVEGEVRNKVDFGVFIGFDGDIDGLIHVSDVSWEDDSEAVLEPFEKGQMVKCKILAVDVEKERIALGIKQLSNDPFEDAIKGLKKGNVVTCTVTNVQDDGIEVSVIEGITSFIKRVDLARDKVEQRPERFASGDRLDAKITSLDATNRKVGLSIKALEIEEQKKAIEEYGSADSGASLGDILGAALNQSGEGEAESGTSDKDAS